MIFIALFFIKFLKKNTTKGTPSNASFANLNNLDFECVTGLNLPMMLEVLINRDIKTLKELVNIAVDVKKNSIFNLREIVLEK